MIKLNNHHFAQGKFPPVFKLSPSRCREASAKSIHSDAQASQIGASNGRVLDYQSAETSEYVQKPCPTVVDSCCPCSSPGGLPRQCLGSGFLPVGCLAARPVAAERPRPVDGDPEGQRQRGPVVFQRKRQARRPDSRSD